MLALYSPMSVGDYCKALNDDLISVNEEYQRNAGVWTAYARSFFIESILLEYPIPKIFLYSKVDLRTRSTVKEIVDGQQRSHTLQSFYNGKFRLSSKIETEELRGKNYSELNEDYQTRFISYNLPVDEFRGVQPVEIQESFRRMNASNVALNDEEQRNAKFQGPFKWFIQTLCHHSSESLRVAGIFNRRDIIRMADTKFFTEIVHYIENGFTTTKSNHLDALYKKYNVSFSLEEEYTEQVEFGVISALQVIKGEGRELERGYMFQSIALVLMDRKYNLGLLDKAASTASDQANRIPPGKLDLASLVDALRRPEDYPGFGDFVTATKGTNVGVAKAVRFLYFNAAI